MGSKGGQFIVRRCWRKQPVCDTVDLLLIILISFTLYPSITLISFTQILATSLSTLLTCWSPTYYFSKSFFIIVNVNMILNKFIIFPSNLRANIKTLSRRVSISKAESLTGVSAQSSFHQKLFLLIFSRGGRKRTLLKCDLKRFDRRCQWSALLAPAPLKEA